VHIPGQVNAASPQTFLANIRISIEKGEEADLFENQIKSKALVTGISDSGLSQAVT
jgi:hypothetical protein